MALSVLGVYASCVVVYVLSHVRLFCDPVTVVGSSVHGISQARRLEWVAISFSGSYPDPGMVPMSPVYQADSLPLSHLGSPCFMPEASSKYFQL